jgi:hypothetical protein
MTTTTEAPVATTPSLQDLFDLSVGDLVESKPLMPGMTAERVLLQVVHKDENSTVFSVTFFQVVLCTQALVRDQKGDLIWLTT